MSSQVTRQTFSFQLDKEKLRKAELRDGHYLLRSNWVSENPAVLWECYIQLMQVEAAFHALKSELGLRPIYHQVKKRVEAHIFVGFLAYALWVTLKRRLVALAPSLTPRAVLEKLATLQMLDVCLPTTDWRWLIMPRCELDRGAFAWAKKHLFISLELLHRSVHAGMIRAYV